MGEDVSSSSLARRGQQATGYPESVATTWSLSFAHIEQNNPAAADLLQLCAFMAPDHIPEELFTDAAAYWPMPLREAVADRLRFNQMISELLSFSLVKRLSEDRLLSIHRLVQVVQLERMPEQKRRQWSESLVGAVDAIFPRNPTDPVVAWPLCRRYLEQAQACDILIQEHELVLPEAAALLDRTATYLREHALYPLAEPLYQRALHINEQQGAGENVQTADILTNLAVLYLEQAKYKEAEALYRHVLQIREQ
ncbi:tetratricopeptide repeat protein [Dictyobacter alpinus]|uniref:tetratricopeptide repeat protein n=1 Tax=Dictyobacter alpinus TaxID=2014873 RepID=UPI001FE5E7EE|nr:tetratricopeptide repeat protein [Dictyobacter alpinus]